MRLLLLTIGLTVLMAGMAQAEVFRIPEEGTGFSIEVPDTWNPNVSDNMIDTTSPDRVIFFWLAIEKKPDVAAVKAAALKALTRNGMKIDQASAKESTGAFAGLDSTEAQYSATDNNNQPRLVRIRTAKLDAKRFLQLVQWGPAAAFDKHAAALTTMFASAKVVVQ
jgi:hypothetical protein